MRCYRRHLNISNKDHVTKNEEVRNISQNVIGVHDDLLLRMRGLLEGGSSRITTL